MSFRRPHELSIDELREILSLPNHLIAIISPDGTFYKVNEEANPVLGWEPGEVIGRKVRDFVHPEDWDETYTTMASVFLGGRSVVEDMRNRIKKKDGTWRWVSWTGKASGGYIYAHGSDVTEKIEFEEALTVQSLVLESITEGVVICNNKGQIVFANTAAEKLFGYEMEELLGKNVTVLSTLSDGEKKSKIKEIMDTLTEDRVWMGEFQNLRKDKQTIFTACRVTTLDLHGERHFVCVQRDITTKKRLSDEREKLETRFRAFFEQSSMAMYIYDTNGRMLEANRASEILFQTTKEASKDFNLLTDRSSHELGVLPYIHKALNGEPALTPPYYIEQASLDHGKIGRARWIEVLFSPIKGPDGKTRELAVIVKDVTDQHLAQSGLAELETKYRVASESLSLAVKVGKIGVWEWLPKEDRVIWDETTQEIFGYEKGLSPRSTEEYRAHFHEDDTERCWEIINRAMKNRIPYTMDHRIYRKDGVIRWVQGSGMPFYNAEGEVVRILGTEIDITERKEHEDDQKFIAHISEILSSSFDYKNNIQRVLDLAVEKYFDGASVYEIKNGTEKISIAVANNDQAKLDAHRKLVSDHLEVVRSESNQLLNKLMADREFFSEDFEQVLRSSGFPENYVEAAGKLEIKSIFLTYLQGKAMLNGIAGFNIRHKTGKTFDERRKKLAREISYRISNAIENSVLYHKSQEAIRARDEFLSIASHELKTPLQSLTLQNEMRKRLITRGAQSALDKDDLQRALEMDHRQLRRINRLIDDMLDISRIRNAKLSIQKESFNLMTLLNDMHERMRPQFEAVGCEYRSELPAELIVHADSYRLEQVFVNLFVNAMKYGAGKPIVVRAKKTDKLAIIEVEDHGPGIREEDLERIFLRFERAVTGNEVTGLGLGLYIAREIMELHRGRVYARSSLGRGSTFVLELPL